MNELSHDDASYLLLRGYLSADERKALRKHLAQCDACLHDAAVHVFLARELPKVAAHPVNRQQFRKRFLDKVQQKQRRKQWSRPIYALASLSMVILTVIVGWLWTIQLAETSTPPSVQDNLPPTEAPPAIAVSPTPEPPSITPKGTLITRTIPAPSLQGALIEEVAEQIIAVYLPPSYGQSDRRYPVVYWLSSGEGPSEGRYRIGEAQQAMDELLEAAQVQEMIVVVHPLPYRRPILYHNSPVSGNWADFLLLDVVGYVDANLRTVAQPGARGLGGEAFTATNVLDIAMRHPGVFGAVYLKHPLLFVPGAMDNSFLTSRQSVRGVLNVLSELDGLSPQEAHERYTEILNEQEQRLDYTLTMLYGMAYVPNADGTAPYFDYLYVAEDEPAEQEVWERWEQGFGGVPEKIAQHAAALRQLNGLYIEYSPHSMSFSWSNEGAPYLAQQLEASDVPFTLDEYVGSAVLDTVARMKAAMFPFFSDVLAGPE